MRISKHIAFGSILLVGLVSMSAIESGGDWVAPPEADKLVNPVANDDVSTKAGKKTYNQMCSICHGAKGKGDGIAGAALNPRPSNFSKEAVQSQSDGAIYWKLTEGRAPMASYRETLSEEQRWQLVNYIRTFKK